MADRAWHGCLRNDTAIVGVGDSDYADDYART